MNTWLFVLGHTLFNIFSGQFISGMPKMFADVLTTHGELTRVPKDVIIQLDGLVQERRNSIANALELRLYCTNPSICKWVKVTWINWRYTSIVVPVWFPTQLYPVASEHKSKNTGQCGLKPKLIFITKWYYVIGLHIWSVVNDLMLM